MSLRRFFYNEKTSTGTNLNDFTQKLSPDEIKATLKCHHTTKASLLAYALDHGFITDKHYLNSTFTLMFKVVSIGTKPSHTTTYSPLVLTIHEDFAGLIDDIRRMFSIPNKASLSVKGCVDGFSSIASQNAGPCFLDLVGGTEAVLRYLKMEAARNYILVEVK